MNRLHLTLLLSALSVPALIAMTPPGHASQHKAAQAPPTAAPQGEKPKPQEAAARAKSPAAAPMTIGLQGVTADNAAKITQALQKLTHNVTNGWKCPGCNATQAEKGQCAKCKKDLVPNTTTANVVREAKVDPATGALSLALAPGQSIELSELSRTLQPTQATLKDRDLAVPAFSRLFVSAPADTKEAQAAVRKALDESKLFSGYALHYNDAKKQYVALIEGVQGTPTYGGVANALSKAGTDIKLVDLAWTGPCETCAKAGMVQAGCKACWHEGKAAKS